MNLQYCKTTKKMAKTKRKIKKVGLEKFENSFFLTAEEKEYRMAEYQQSLDEGNIDSEFVWFLTRLNELDGVVTTECCSGHGEKGRSAYVDIRTDITFGVLAQKLALLMKTGRVTWEIAGYEMGMPRHVFRLEQAGWQDLVDCLIYCLTAKEDVKKTLIEDIQ